MCKILVVDDKYENRRIIANVLEQNKAYNVLQANNGNLAYRIAIESKPDLIITDWEMPEIDGITLIKQLKKNPETMEIPVVMATGVMKTSHDLNTALEAGSVDYIRTPVEPLELTARVRSMLELNNSYKKLKELATFKSLLIGIIGHDLRSPFNILLGFSDLLIKDWYDISDVKKLEYINLINDKSKKTLELLNELLTWAKSLSGDVVLRPSVFKINTIIDDVIKLYDAIAREKSILLTKQDFHDIYVYADFNTIRTILRNFVNNAIKFTKEHGSISIEVEKENKHLAIKVIDTGVGIHEEKLRKLFTLESVESIGTKGEKGTGLGLLFSKEFIEKNNGEIRVESQAGKGSIFTFTIPLYEKQNSIL